MRYTEYHNGVAVIRDKSKHKEAMEKLAAYEDLENKSNEQWSTCDTGNKCSTNAEAIPNPVKQPKEFAKWYMKVATRLEADDHPALLDSFLDWLNRSARIQGGKNESK